MKQKFFMMFIAAAVVASAQETKTREERMTITVNGAENHVFAGGAMGAAPTTFSFVSAEFSSEGKLVKGQPYSGETSTESTQTLSDGTKIVNKSTARIFRDSDGRTRREQSLGSVGPWSTEGNPQSLVFINDPVSGTNYVLDSSNKSVRKTTVVGNGAMPFIFAKSGSGSGSGVGMGVAGTAGLSVATLSASASRTASSADKGNVDFKNESLGKDTVEGLLCDGTRTTLTIPAGQIGNDKPILVVTEKWYSPDLQVTVMSKTSDPRMGDTVYRLTGVSRAEPSHAMFEPPADYTVKTEDVVKERVMHLTHEE